jgi:hypothetical protein
MVDNTSEGNVTEHFVICSAVSNMAGHTLCSIISIDIILQELKYWDSPIKQLHCDCMEFFPPQSTKINPLRGTKVPTLHVNMY